MLGLKRVLTVAIRPKDWYNRMVKTSVVLGLVVCVVLGLAFGRQMDRSTLLVSKQRDSAPCIIVDAGHGGFDGGAVALDGTVEKEINLSVALKLQKLLQFHGAEVIMTRTEDIGTDRDEGAVIARRKKSDLQNRLALMEEHPNALYVSIHLNKFTTGAASGAQVFYTPNFDEAAVLGQCLQDAFVKELQPENKRTIKKGTSSTYLLKNAKVPAVIVECGFLSNRQELKELKDPTYQSKLSFVILSGILKYFEQE